MKRLLLGLAAAITIGGGLVLAPGVAAGGDDDDDGGGAIRTYRVTIENLTVGQPFSPGVAATHRKNTGLFHVGQLASPGIEAIAEAGNEAPGVAEASALPGVTDVHDINMPITPQGTVVGSFTDTLTFEIEARGRDRLSLAVMLICTNDGFTGLDGVKLPKRGSVEYFTNGYDAGTERNTERSQDIVDPCSALGPVALAGDPDGNDDAGVDTAPHRPITHHTNVHGGSELSFEEHSWADPVAKITIERID